MTLKSIHLIYSTNLNQATWSFDDLFTRTMVTLPSAVKEANRFLDATPTSITSMHITSILIIYLGKLNANS